MIMKHLHVRRTMIASTMRAAAAVAVAIFLAGAKASPVQPPAPAAGKASSGLSSERTGAGDLADTTSELLRLLIRRGLVPAREETVRRAVLRAVLEAVDCGAELDGQDPDGDVAPPPPGVLRREVVGGVFAYLLLGRLTPDSIDAFAACAHDVGEGHYEGAVVDLRLASGPDPKAAEECAKAFGKPEIPIAVLIGPETVGAGEVLARRLRASAGAVLLGNPTAGRPFGQERRRLTSGDVVYVPVTGADSGNRTAAVLPDVLVEADLDGGRLRTRLLDLDKDLDMAADDCLRRAVDLLRCVRVLGSRPRTTDATASPGKDRATSSANPDGSK